MTIYVSNPNLFSLLDSEENDVLDFKSADLLIDPDGENRYKIAKHIVGSSNHRGGEIIFGVNDDREPEGKDIREEESLGTISEIISSRINPPVEFTYTFYTSDKGGISEGSIFVLEVPESSASVPHAIVDNSGDKIRKREYRIRAGDSTRLVSNEELLALFNDDFNQELETVETIYYLLESDYTPANIKYKPSYQHSFERHFEKLGDKESTLIDKVTKGEPIDSDEGIRAIIDTQYAITLSSILSSLPFIMISEYQIDEKLANGVAESAFDLKSLEPSDVILESDNNPLIQETELEKIGILPPYNPEYDHFKIPNTASVRVGEDFKEITIGNDEFQLKVAIGLLETAVGLPSEHPESVSEHAVYGEAVYDRSKATMTSPIEIETEFKYPDISFPAYESYRAYCETFINTFENEFDWEGYVEQLPHDKIFQIEKRIEELHENLGDSDTTE